ncbi:MAG TPA: hypothetical protein VGK97_04865 [Spongiibacteraceae bacterium]|jgi:uncharacterized membrane protein YiaA
MDASALRDKNITNTLDTTDFYERRNMSFGIYIAGYFIFIVGLALGAYLLNVPPQWIGVGVLCMVGIAIIHGVTATRQKDSS